MRPRIKWVCASILAMFAGAAAPSALAEGSPGAIARLVVQAQHSADCLCRAAGRTYAVGESACLRTPAGARIADCGMVLNNTSWEFTERSCPDS